jgi:hypothetical protein
MGAPGAGGPVSRIEAYCREQSLWRSVEAGNFAIQGAFPFYKEAAEEP